MPKALTAEQIALFRRDGFTGPVRVLSADEAGQFRALIETYEDRIGQEAQTRLKMKAHLPFKTLSDLIRRPSVLDAIEDLIGPNIMCWGSSFFSKEARDPRFVSWHQDTTYYGLDPGETCTAWIALSDSTHESGCVRFLPSGAVMGETLRHRETDDPLNLLARGQTLDGIDESRAVEMVLRAGEMSIHHERSIHGSQPNHSDDRRIGYSIHYIAPHVRQTGYDGASAALVRGVDTHGFWQPEMTPSVDFDEAGERAMDAAWAQYLAASHG